VSGAADAGGGNLATSFAAGTADAGVKIVISGRTYTIVSVATAGGLHLFKRSHALGRQVLPRVQPVTGMLFAAI
jgi:hypothetical protein